MTREIPLSKGKVALVDDNDFAWLSQWKWSFHSGGYAYRLISENGRRKAVHMHRLIINAPDGMDVDHVDGDGLNNRRSNLRIATRSENLRNRRTRAPSSGYKGVALHRQSGLYRSVIYLDTKQITLGYFRNATDAALAYDAKARELFGAFARLNFPQDGEQAA